MSLSWANLRHDKLTERRKRKMPEIRESELNKTKKQTNKQLTERSKRKMPEIRESMSAKN